MTTSNTKAALTLNNFAVSAYRHTLANGHTVEIVQPMDEEEMWVVRSEDGKLEYCQYNGWQESSFACSLEEAVELVNKLEDAIAAATTFDEEALRALYAIERKGWSDMRQQIARFPELMQGLLDLPTQIGSAPTLKLGWLNGRENNAPDLLVINIDAENRRELADVLNPWLEDQNLSGLMFVVE